MDKFDQNITEAKPMVEPTNNNFVDDTMNKLGDNQPNQPKKKFNLKLWAPIIAGALVIVVVVFVLVIPGKAKDNTTAKTIASSNPAVSSVSPTKTASSPGTDDSDLSNDLADVQTSMNQENSDQNSTTSAINDSSQEITVPTN